MAVVDVLAVTDGFGLQLSTTAEAAAHYRRAVVELLGDRPSTQASFASALQSTPRFALGHAGLAVLLVRSGWRPDRALAQAEGALDGATRRERQHVGILVTALTGDPIWAVAKARHHLDEFAGDVVVLNVVGTMAAATGNRGVQTAVRRLIADRLPHWERS